MVALQTPRFQAVVCISESYSGFSFLEGIALGKNPRVEKLPLSWWDHI